MILFLILVYFIDYLKHCKTPRSYRHSGKKEVEKMIGTLAITAGIKKPILKIILSNTPTAFTIINKFGGEYIINVSIGLLNVLDRIEIEAVLAHEISHIKAGQILDYRIINILLEFLKIVASGFFILIISVFIPSFFYFWILVLLFFSVEGYFKDNTYLIDKDSIWYVIFIALMPTFSLINFIACLIYYSLGHNEDFYADLNAILVTRYPHGLYSALERIEKYDNQSLEVGFSLSYLYFSSEKFHSKIPFPQPTIALRKRMIEKIEQSLKSFRLKKSNKKIHCSLCHTLMKELKMDSHYFKQNVVIDKCPNCHSVWFDKSELIYIADLLMLTENNINKSKLQYSKFEDYLICPKCGIKLYKQNSANIPDEVDIYNCRSCGGDFMMNDDIYEYGMYKRKR
ncbi:zf-TFIIB domain-containing protein [Candidatus Parcubacteria bacterium]|nr:zf-TFIIB domain-containing protein [Candidatus Parcubacteria bacterium]